MPVRISRTLAEQLVRQRTSLGLSQKESAGRIGVDPGTLAKWERGERESLLGRSGTGEAVSRGEEERRSSSRRVG